VGWNSANEIFDPVAEAVIRNRIDMDAALDILVTLIRNLQAEDWDTEDESLEAFSQSWVVAEAFKRCGVPSWDSFDEEWAPKDMRCLGISIQRLDKEVPLPVYAKDGDAGVDLHAVENFYLAPGQRKLIPTGIAVAIPKGYVGLIHPRSGLADKYGLSIVNAPGTIDSGYRGEVKVNLINLGQESITFVYGSRIAQMVLQKVEEVQFTEVDELPSSERGSSGHGSSDLRS
jgi:dUTP pyrophosphatase